MTQLFDRLPDRLFSPLASANRRTYGALLLDLYPLFFDQIHADIFPSRETVRHEIEERLAVLAVAWQEEADAEVLPTGTMGSNLASRMPGGSYLRAPRSTASAGRWPPAGR